MKEIRYAKRPRKVVKRMHKVLREVETEVAAIVEGGDETEPVSPNFDKRPAAIGSASPS
jgi:hypothetical protein